MKNKVVKRPPQDGAYILSPDYEIYPTQTACWKCS